MYGCVAPLMQHSVKGVDDCVMSSNGASAICTTNGMVGMGIRGAGTRCAVVTAVGAGAWFKDGVTQPEPHGDVENGVRHVVRGKGGEVEPRATARLLWRHADVVVVVDG